MKTSLSRGWKLTLNAWPLVLLNCFVFLVVFFPFRAMTASGIDRALGEIPDGFQLPQGDFPLLLRDALFPVMPAIAVTALCGIILGSIWRILWHGGTARLVAWEPEAPFSTGRALGFGMIVWPRYFRLTLVLIVALLLVVGGNSALFFWGIRSAYEAMNEQRMVTLAASGLLVNAILKLILFSAGFRASWELARPLRRSAFLAFLRGLRGTARRPISSVLPMLFPGLGIPLLTTIPLWVLITFSPGAISTTLISLGAALLVAFAEVWLYFSYASTTEYPGRP